MMSMIELVDQSEAQFLARMRLNIFLLCPFQKTVNLVNSISTCTPEFQCHPPDPATSRWFSLSLFTPLLLNHKIRFLKKTLRSTAIVTFVVVVIAMLFCSKVVTQSINAFCTFLLSKNSHNVFNSVHNIQFYSTFSTQKFNAYLEIPVAGNYIIKYQNFAQLDFF